MRLRELLWASDPKDQSQKDQATSNRHQQQEQNQQQWHWPAVASPDSPRDWNKSINSTDWAAFKEPRTLLPTLILTGSILTLVRLHRRYLRRFPDASSISPSFFRKRSLFGRVTSVGDGDNFRMFHTPGGKLAGWGWLPWKKVPTLKKELKDKTVLRHNSSERALYVLVWFVILTIDFFFFSLGTRSSGRHRRPRAPSLRPSGAAIRPRCS